MYNCPIDCLENSIPLISPLLSKLCWDKLRQHREALLVSTGTAVAVVVLFFGRPRGFCLRGEGELEGVQQGIGWPAMPS